jgi:curved DNA-binding protein CbpA
MSKYFKNSSYTETSLNKERKKLSFKYHPDKGGKESDFVAMNEEYEVILKHLKNNTYTAEPIKAEKTYQKTSTQTKTAKTEPKKKTQEPIRHIEPDFIFLRSMFQKVHTFSIKYPLLCSNTIHTTLAIIFGLLGIILFLGG